MLASQPVDVLLLDIYVPTSQENHSPFPILHTIPALLKQYPNINILVISMSTQKILIKALVNAGVKGYIFKDDQLSIQKLAAIVEIAGSPYEDRAHPLCATCSPQPMTGWG